jgi:tetratricopeptide (TPR) repeat protein
MDRKRNENSLPTGHRRWTAGLLVVALFLCACAAQRGPSPVIVPRADLPTDEAELLSLALKSYKFEGPVADVRLSMESAERVLQKEPQNELANYYAARAASWLIQFGGEGVDVKTLAESGYSYALAAEKIDEKNGEYPFLAGSLLGFLAQENPGAHMGSLRQIYNEFDRALKLNPDLDSGAPLRAMGMFLVKSPGWPLGVGDSEAGMTHLEHAVKAHPEHPANQLCLAEALVLAGRYEEAVAAMEKTLETLSTGNWGVPGQIWTKQLARLRLKTSEKLKLNK